MNFAKVGGGGLSGIEMVVLAVLVLLCIGVGWALYQRWSGRAGSDVSGLRFSNRGAPRP